MNPKAVVLLSGGLDSTVTAAFAQKRGGLEVYGLSVSYGQRHHAELAAAKKVAAHLGLAGHHQASVYFDQPPRSALTRTEILVPKDLPLERKEIPDTYVPARNTLLLGLALSLAESLEASTVWYGANALDYSGYPDCRPAFVAAFQRVIDCGTVAGIQGHSPILMAPLMDKSKAEIIRLGVELGVDLSLTHSCYSPVGGDLVRGHSLACGHCDSCRIRADGFIEAGVADPTRYAP